MSLLLALGIVVAMATADQQVANPPAAPARWFTLSLRPEIGEIVEGEPLHLTAILRNDSDHIRPVNYISFRQIFFLTCSYEDRPYFECPISVRNCYDTPGENYVLVPGEEAKCEVIIGSAKAGFLFNKPGLWHIRINTGRGRTVAESTPVDVFVKPIPPEEKGAADLLRSPEMAYWLSIGESQAYQKLMTLIERYPKSVYADHARLAVVTYVAEGSDNRVGVANRAPDPKKAFEIIAGVSPRVGALRVRALIRMAHLLDQYPELREKADGLALEEEMTGYSHLAKELGYEQWLNRAIETTRKIRKVEAQPVGPVHPNLPGDPAKSADQPTAPGAK
jgi:hypothetical protein